MSLENKAGVDHLGGGWITSIPPDSSGIYSEMVRVLLGPALQSMGAPKAIRGSNSEIDMLVRNY